MKTKIFSNSGVYLEKEMNNFFTENPNIEIISVTQSSSNGHNFTTHCVVLIYKEKE